MRIQDLPRIERPREKLMAKGVANLKNEELLAILLRTGVKGVNVVELSKRILHYFPVNKLLQTPFDDIKKIKGVDSSKACTLLAAFELTKRALSVDDNAFPIIVTSHDVVDILHEYRNLKKEHFIALYLNTRNQLIHKEIISIGTVNSSIVHPREVFEPAIKYVASHIILSHNHPSGDPDPSDADITITKRLIEAGQLMGIEVIDHIILSQRSYFSFRESDLIKDAETAH